MAHGNAQFSHGHIAYEGDSNTSLCSFKAAFPRLPALYYVFLQQLREEGKISMVSNLPLGKPKLREVKSNHLDNLVKSIDVQFSAVSSSLLLSYDVAGLFPPSPHLPGTPQSSSVWCPTHLREGLLLFLGQSKERVSEVKNSFPPPSHHRHHKHIHPSPRPWGEGAKGLQSESQGADLPVTGAPGAKLSLEGWISRPNVLIHRRTAQLYLMPPTYFNLKFCNYLGNTVQGFGGREDTWQIRVCPHSPEGIRQWVQSNIYTHKEWRGHIVINSEKVMKELRSEWSELSIQKQQRGTPGCRKEHAEVLKLKYIWTPFSRR